MLIDAQSLFALINENNKKDLIIFDCRFGLPGPNFDPDYGRSSYERGHIPGAIYVDLETELSAPVTLQTGRHPLPDNLKFTQLLKSHGVDKNSTIVVYDDKSGMIAARMWWMLSKWVGCKNVHILDGGFPAWEACSKPLSTEIPIREPSNEVLETSELYLKNTENIKNIVLSGQDGSMIDARALPRYQGVEEPIDPIAGHIPGAVCLPCAGNIGSNGKFLSCDELKSRFEPFLKDRNIADVVHYCGSGVTACHNLFAMELAGFSGSSLYAGSWSEWIRDTNNSIGRQE